MSDVALLVGGIGASYVGFAVLALSQAHHWRQVMNAPPPSGRLQAALRMVGSTALIVSLVFSLLRDGASFGTVLWVAALSAAAIAVAFTLTWRARWLRPLAHTVQWLFSRAGVRIP